MLRLSELTSLFTKKNIEKDFIVQIESYNQISIKDIDESLYSTYRKALLEHAAARNRFNHAAPDYVDVAILEIAVAEARLRAVINEVRDKAQ